MNIGGDDNSTMTVIGDEVDAVTLTRSLGKKFRSATLVGVEKVVKVYRYNEDHQVAASMIYEGQPADYYNNNNNNNFSQPMSFYNSPLPQYTPQYYYPYQRPDDSGCSIM